MPQLIALPWLVPLITGIGAATSLGVTGYDLASGGGSSSSSSAAATAQQQQQAAQTAAQQKAALLAAENNINSQTGGSLTPGGTQTFAANQAGIPQANLQSILQSLGGSGGGSSGPISGGTTTPNSSPGNPNDLQGLTDLLKQAA
jgi:hypothetical protein